LPKSADQVYDQKLVESGGTLSTAEAEKEKVVGIGTPKVLTARGRFLLTTPVISQGSAGLKIVNYIIINSQSALSNPPCAKS
jgi:hypothetical protein